MNPRGRIVGTGLAGLSLAIAGLSGANAEERTLVPGSCTLDGRGTGVVAEVVDATSLALDSGEIVRLAAIDLPPGFGDPSAVPPELSAAIGREVRLGIGEEGTDRYGRTLAQIYLEPDGTWLQALLLEQGRAVVVPVLGDYRCIADLLRYERSAREAGRGLWQNRSIPDAYSDTIRTEGGRFALVEGRVVSLGRTDSTVYLNFGWDWDFDLTVTFGSPDADIIEGESGPLDDLVGEVIRVRGWLTQRDGPWIRVDHGEQIELLSGGDAGAVD